jgi:predicted TIM-barrel fold metal-dependent hydrolase
MEPYYALAEELDVPLGIHLGHPGRDPDTGSPAGLGTVLQQHPGLRLYLIHAGGAFLEAAIELMVAHPTVYADLSALVWREPQEDFYGRLRRLIDAGLEDRIMFGTDQLIWPELIPVAIQSVESAPVLSAEQKHKIFYANAARFFRLE